MNSTRFEIRSGTPVVCIDGEVGKVAFLVSNPGTGELRSLVVRKGFLLRKDVVVPLEAVVEATAERVQVRLTEEEMNRLPEYVSSAFEQPSADWHSEHAIDRDYVLVHRFSEASSTEGTTVAGSGQMSAMAGGRMIRTGQLVHCRDGEAGSVALVLLDAAHRRVTHLVMRKGAFVHHDLLIDIHWVSDITQFTVKLDLKRKELEQLPEYRPDEEIVADVLDELWYRSGLESADLTMLDVRAKDGIVELIGNTRTEAAKYKIESTARHVRSVLGVVNHVESLEELARHTLRKGTPSSTMVQRK